MRGWSYKLFIAFLLIILPVLLAGCWDNRELNDTSIVSGLGWDIDPETGAVTFTVQSIIPSETSGNAGSSEAGKQQGGGSLRTIELDQDTGPSLYEAVSRLTQHMSRSPFYEHTAVYIFGKDAVQQGINEFIDVQARNPDSYPTVLMAVSAEKNASDIMSIPDGMDNIQAFGMAEEIKLSARFSKYPKVTVLDFQKRLLSATTAPIAPIVGIAEEIDRQGEKVPKIRVVGTAVFKGDRMIGQLNERESSGLLWAINKINIGFLTIPQGNLEIIKSKTKIIPELQGDQVKITIEVSLESDLILYKDHQEISPDLIQQLEEEGAAEVESQIMAAVNKAVALDADVFGFGEAVHRKYKREWQAMKPQWDEIYPGIKVAVKVRNHINEIGEANETLIKD
ncbi:MAG: Ger(x)C family spore germination protein [Syntrophomonadaceae bacterium]|nr:Ger(x)C family spore germination protein [Syntrophomonadaceae bacterium]